jgi:hypothetical protein
MPALIDEPHALAIGWRSIVLNLGRLLELIQTGLAEDAPSASRFSDKALASRSPISFDTRSVGEGSNHFRRRQLGGRDLNQKNQRGGFNEVYSHPAGADAFCDAHNVNRSGNHDRERWRANRDVA